jgi:hypothetical protein
METDLPKYIAPNPYNYTKTDFAKRKRDIKAMIRDYPTVSPMWCEWLYDIIENMPKEEVEKIINEGQWEGPSKFAVAQGGVLNTVEVFNEDFTPFKENEKAICAE